MQQFGQSATSDLIWNAVKEMFSGYALDASLDRRRNAREEGRQRSALTAMARLPELTDNLQRALSASAAGDIPQTAVQALQRLRGLSLERKLPPAETVRALRAHVAAEAMRSDAHAEYAQLLAGLDAVLRPMT